MKHSEIKQIAAGLSGEIVLHRIKGGLYTACGGKYTVTRGACGLRKGWLVKLTESPNYTQAWRATLVSVLHMIRASERHR